MQLDVVGMTIGIAGLDDIQGMDITRNRRLCGFNSGVGKQLQQLILGFDFSLIN